MRAPINVSPHPPLPREVGQSWGFDLIRIQLPHPPGNVRIQILTGHALRVSYAHFSDSISRPLGLGASLPFQTRKIPHPVPGGGVGANIDRHIIYSIVLIHGPIEYNADTMQKWSSYKAAFRRAGIDLPGLNP